MIARRLVTAALLATACARPPYDAASSDARTLRAPGEPPMHAVAYPPRGKSNPPAAPLLVVEPVVWRRDLLLRHGGLVSWLEDDGFPVWLVGADGDPRDARALADGIVRTAGVIARATGAPRVDVLATGLGGAATMLALDPLTSPSSPVHVGRVAFLGTPLDRAYVGDANARVAASTLAFHDRSAVEWLGAVPPADRLEGRPARERFPFAARFAALPVLFVAGKVDGIAPSETQYPAFALWGRDAEYRHAVPKSFFLAGRENGFDRDADAFDLVDGSPTAIATWSRIAAFLGE
jgi:hypothetical protein